MKRRNHLYFVLTLVVVLIGITFLSFLKNSSESKIPDSPVETADYISDFKNKYGVYAPILPETLDFAGDKVPLEFFDVKESLDREIIINTYWHSRTFLVIKKAHRYFPIIEKILKEQGVPDDFKYLAVAESGLDNVISPAKAVGFWQFLKATAQDYDLVVNDEVDERYHLEKATVAACDFLKHLYKQYEDWALVAAAYNMGKSGLDKQIARQGENDYYDLLLNDETARYLYRILSYKVVMSNPENFGFKYRVEDLYPEVKTYTVKVDATIEDLAKFAQKNGSNYKMLKHFNPWLRKKTLTIENNETYLMKFPADGARKTVKKSETKSVKEKGDTLLK